VGSCENLQVERGNSILNLVLLDDDRNVSPPPLLPSKLKSESTRKLVQSLNSPFFPPHVGAEPGRAKDESRITCMRMLRAQGAHTLAE